MARRSEITKLAALALVRDAQRKAAELAVAQADALLQSAEAEQKLVDEELVERESAWSAAVASSTFNLTQVGAWAAAVLAGQADLERVAGEVNNARMDCHDKRQVWGMASARAQVADRLKTRAQRQMSHRIEEGRLADQADRSALRGARP